MSIKDWCTVYPLAIDITSGPCGMPDLFNNEDLTRVSQIHAVRDAAITLERLVGTDGYEYGSIRYHIHDGYLMLGELNPDPVPIGDRGIVFCKYDGDSTELHWMDEYGHILKFTNYGYLNASLDSVYDGPDGYGSGRIMAIDEGPVVMNKSVDDDPALEIVGDTDPHLELLFVEALNQDGGAASISVETYTNSSGDNWCYWGGMYSEDAGGELGAGDICGVYLAEVGIDTGAYDDPDSKLIAYEAIRLETDAKTIAFHATDDGTAWTTAFEADSGNMALHDGYVQLGEVSDPTTDGAHGFVFCQQDNYSELFFMNSNGDKLQLTKDGRLNATLDSVYDGPDGSGSGRQINVDSGAVDFLIQQDGPGIFVQKLNAQVASAQVPCISTWWESNIDGQGGIVSLLDPRGFSGEGITSVVDNAGLFASVATPLAAGKTGRAFLGYSVGNASDDSSSFMVGAGMDLLSPTGGTAIAYSADSTGGSWDVAFNATSGEVWLDGGALRFNEQGSDPTNVVNKGFLYCKDDGGDTELFYQDDTGNVVQITEDGYLATYNSVPGVGLWEQASDPTPTAEKGFLYTKDDSGDTELYYMDNSGNILQISNNGTFNLSLDSVYDGPDGSGSGRSITADSGAVFIDASGTDALRLDGYLQLDEISDPTSRPNSGMIYAKDDGGNTELFYMDDGGNVTQLTEDGYLATFNSLPGVGLWEQSSDPTPATDKAFIYVKDAYGTSELHFMDNYGVVTQVTTDGYANLTPGILQTTPDDPDPRDDAGFIYSADVDGYVELHYMDNYGSITQITADGYLAYTPESDAYWDGYAPTTVQEALDRIAAALGPISL